MCDLSCNLEPWHFITSAHQLGQDIEQPAADIRERVRSSHIVVYKDNIEPKVVIRHITIVAYYRYLTISLLHCILLLSTVDSLAPLLL